jgi:hypothetical protein
MLRRKSRPNFVNGGLPSRIRQLEPEMNERLSRSNLLKQSNLLPPTDFEVEVIIALAVRVHERERRVTAPQIN